VIKKKKNNMLDLKFITEKIKNEIIIEGARLKEFRTNFKVDKVIEKNTHDYVSYVDKQMEEIITKKLKNILPEAGFITEEGTREQTDEEYLWVVDPLDGTTNFIHDYAPYCISIALRSRKELLIGVVFEVTRNECFYGWKEGGAYLNGTPIHVNNDKDINHALICLELPYNADDYSKTMHYMLTKFYGNVSAIRMNGSAATSLCYIAAGRLDGWCESYIGLWDYSAGTLLIEEAGGKVTNFLGNSTYLNGHHIIAGTKNVHQALFNRLQECLPPNI